MGRKMKSIIKNKENIDSVRFSRAGDAFHYRWAARRCLRLIDPRCPVQSVTIEASLDSKLQGECAIDLAEYSESSDGQRTTHYIQLKHSTVRQTKPLGLSDLGATLEAFAQRYSAHLAAEKDSATHEIISFSFVSNRHLGPQLAETFEAIRKNVPISAARRRQLEKATLLSGDLLRSFFVSLRVLDGEGDYVVQREQLHGELSEYLAGFIDSDEVDKIVNLVSERALPHAVKNRRKGEILREDVLQKLGVTSDRCLFPAPREFEILSHVIQREQHDILVKHILQATTPVIIHAAGGIGKSVVARQIAESLPKGSFGLVYDCFGSGKYRNPSEPRHRACDALVQIANELAASGYCRTLIGQPGTPADALFRAFRERLKEAVQALREIDPGAVLVILIDAADNAEMAAMENSQQSFAHGLLHESVPEGCRLVALCRTERREMLRPQSSVIQLSLEPFSEKETAAHLRSSFSDATADDVREFHRLTGGNPRVQAITMSRGCRTVEETLANLGPAGTTVAEQIALQLQIAVAGIKDRSISDVAKQVDAICLGLANLPPFIPVAVLAKAAQVEESTILSFVSDLGHPLWHSDRSVMFRDEPTETWFCERFAADPEQIKRYVALLEPLAKYFPYVAKALPQLLLKSEDYSRLVDLALSDDFLPENNPIDARNIRVYRLQFAFRAALRLGRTADAAQVAFRAGEEVAGDQRQLLLLRQNADMVAPLLDPTRVQELAYRQLLRGGWQGSSNVYSASLLSSVDDFKGEARGYLRAARKWLTIFFEERAKQDEHSQFHERLQDSDLVEMAWAHFNLSGAEELATFLIGWKPPQVMLRLTRLVVRRLVDAARFDEIDKLALHGRKNPFLILAVASELEPVAQFPPKKGLKPTLTLLVRKGLKKPEEYSYEDNTTPTIVSFCEACVARGLPNAKILAVLEYYTEAHATANIGSDFQESARKTFLRGVALRAVLNSTGEPNPETLLPLKDPQSGGRNLDRDEERNLVQMMRALLPWYFLRARYIARDSEAPAIDLENLRSVTQASANSHYRRHDRTPYEISALQFSVLALKENVTEQELQQFTHNVVAQPENKFSLNHRFGALYSACRLSHLSPLRSILENSCVAAVEPKSTETPEERAESYIQLARAVFAVSAPDASTYFDHAIDAVSKFGDELVPRWEALLEVARRASEGESLSDQMAHLFFKCAEMVGESVEREKYWSRSDVFRIGVHLHAQGAFAAMSRWRDREVGWFDRPMLALAIEAVDSGRVAALSGWSLSGFLACNAKADFAATCIRREPEHSNRKYILDAAVRDLELAGSDCDSWTILQEIAKEFGLQNERLTSYLGVAEFSIVPNASPTETEVIPYSGKSEDAADWDRVFIGIDLLSPNGIARAEATYRETKPPFESGDFWNEVVQRVPGGRETEFLDLIPLAESVNSYDVSNLLRPLRLHWMCKASVKASWPRFLRSIGKRYAAALAESGHLEYWESGGMVREEELVLVKEGILRGLAESLDLVDARTFFGFIANVAPELTPEESKRLFDYALTRFELHIDSDFGDGPWADWLIAPSTTTDALAGLIWSALGSPISATRWQAVHCVRRLVEAGCDAEIESLFGWLQRDAVGAFGSHRFPFYRLHARLYLLIALDRTACDTADRLHKHAAVIASLALTGMPHFLIQKTAANVALKIEQTMPGSYHNETVQALQQVGLSQFPVRELSRNSGNVDTPWHAEGKVKNRINLYFGIDFDNYWFKYLGNMFGVSTQQVIDLGCDAAVTYVGVTEKDGHQADPRRHLWQSRDYEWGTSHSHGSYPNIDDYWFYYSYHSFLSVAARLLRAMPLIHRDGDFYEDRWDGWLQRHSLTRADGRWLSDRRDPSPIMRREWTTISRDENWRWSITSDDFLDILLHQSPNPHWLCMAGHWTETDGERIESLHISSAFVTPETSESLANSLRWCESPWDCRLPCYEEEDEDENPFQVPPFELTGWIHQEEGSDKRLDAFDPHARGLGYPPYQIGATFAAILSVAPDYEKREWRSSPEGKLQFISELWSEKDQDERDRPYREGARICGAVKELTRLCALLGKDLIFSVEIDRKTRRYRGSSSDDHGYIPASHKFFILSANGQLRDTRKSHQVG